VRFELLLIESIQHVEEILNIAQFLTRQVVFSTNSVSVRIGSDCGDDSKQSVDLFVSECFVLVDVLT
jgi:hypothetical protein